MNQIQLNTYLERERERLVLYLPKGLSIQELNVLVLRGTCVQNTA